MVRDTIALLLMLAGVANANMYDVFSPLKLPGATCSNGCAAWADQNATITGWFADPEHIQEYGSSCAQLAGSPANSKPVPVLDPKGIGGAGAWCMCKAGGVGNVTEGTYDYCVSDKYTPEQINVQIAGPHTVVLSFVTFEPTAPTAQPVAMFGTNNASLTAAPPGVTHTYVTPAKDRTYYMHFVVLADLPPRTRYFYKVKSGSAACKWSSVFSFRSPYSSSDVTDPTTKVAIFGDMGVYSWNNMQNLQFDNENEVVDLVIQMGDHCYNMGGEDDTRGDGYMEAYQPVIANIPWLPIVGNHEFYDGDELRRYLNQTEGTVVAHPVDHPLVKGASSTADTALGRILATGNHHGPGTNTKGSAKGTPSGTSRYYSVDFGLIHFVALDLNMYNAVDTCGETCRVAQLAWLEEDLKQANANRDSVPWIVAMSHFPLYCSNCPKPGHDTPPPGDWWNSEECEFSGHDQSCTSASAGAGVVAGANKVGKASTPTNADMVPDFEPVFMKYGVDVYSSGHIHDYEFIYPTYNNTPVSKSFENPRAPVHLVTGNGGPPSPSHFGKIMPWSYVHSTVYSYTRMIAHNASTMEWIQVANNDSSILTSLTVTQNKHGQFPIPTAAELAAVAAAEL